MLFDGNCPFCRKGVRMVRALDWFGTLTFHNARVVAHLPKADVALDLAGMLEGLREVE